jgi:hypothetical protein
MPSIATLERWSSRYGWVQRAHEYDAHVSEIVLKKQAETDAAERLHLRDLRLSRAEVVAGVASQPADWFTFEAKTRLLVSGRRKHSKVRAAALSSSQSGSGPMGQ